ncbi:protein BREAST CANCER SUSCEPTIBILITY 1 homolog [Cornus florida]|uniref:protein BREAST CANCER SUSCEPTIBILITY 1 homolog n=1 Tax=Cornus florida TaxID=4283 RepID=UPI002896F95F|nr:protein BREAST CANCER SUSCEPTIBILITY 1 homolog [Cornus florida]
MADSSHLEKMGRELKCPICLSLLNSAVSLTCNHVFCNLCIEKSMRSASDCPVCKVPYRRREVRPAPHMDNLVSIYKSMEVASGVNIFVTQMAPSTKLSDGENKPKGDRVSGEQENDGISLEAPDNQRRSGRKRSKQSSGHNLKNSNLNPVKPSFPTKKRVQVPQYPLSETPTRPAKFEGGRGETINGPGKSSVLSMEKTVLNENGEPVFSPFFWLREEDDIEKLSQQIDGNNDIDPTPKAPCFSDIKDSDDEIPSNMTPTGETNIALNDADYFDSEMFEWTQRPCSPELCSTPLKMQVADSYESDGIPGKEGKASSQGTNTIREPKSGQTESVVPKQGADNTEESLPTSSLRTKGTNSEEQIKRSNKRGRKAGGSTRKQAKRSKGEVLGIHAGSQEVAERIIPEKIDNNGNPLNLKARTQKSGGRVEFDAIATETMLENFPTLFAEAKSFNQSDETVVNGSTSSDQKGSSDKVLKSKKTGKSRRKSVDHLLGDQRASFKTQNQDSAKNNVAHDRNVSDLGVGTCNGEIKTITKQKYARELRCSKRPKIFTNNISKGKSVDAVQDGNNKVSAKSKKVQGNSDVKDLNNTSEKERSLPSSGALLRKCGTVLNKIQCSFCHSAEDSEASGVMCHYLNGKPVAADHDGGSKVIHAHRNCTEWAPNVYFQDDNAINLEAELARSRRMKCCCCDIKGAALGCYEKSCRKSFHFTCAKLILQCRWDNDNFVMLCPLHASSKLPNEISGTQVKRQKICNPKRQTQTYQPQVTIKRAGSNSTCVRWNSCGSLQKLVLCCSALTNAEKEIVSEFERLSGVTVLKNWDSSVTHIIASTDENGACRRTLKILIGILEGKWILSIDWIKACMKAMEPVDEEHYEIGVDIHGIRDGPQLGRLRILNKQPKLFNGYKFYFIGDFIASYKGYLQDLIIAAGGTVLHRKPISGHSSSGCSTSPTFIIYSLELPDKSDPSKRNFIINRRRSDAVALASSIGATTASNSWVLNSIAGCKLQNLAE